MCKPRLESSAQVDMTDALMAAAQSLYTLVSETRVKSDWAATLPRAPAVLFFGKAGNGVLCMLAVGFFSTGIYELPSHSGLPASVSGDSGWGFRGVN